MPDSTRGALYAQFKATTGRRLGVFEETLAQVSSMPEWPIMPVEESWELLYQSDTTPVTIWLRDSIVDQCPDAETVARRVKHLLTVGVVTNIVVRKVLP